MPRKTYTPEEVQTLKDEMQRLDAEWQRLRVGYYGGDDTVTYEVLRAAVELYIKATYQFQKAKWGKVRMRLSAAAVMR